MIPEGYEFKSDFAKKYFAEGRESGRAEGEASAVLAVLAARGIQVTPEERERILACSDLTLLGVWIRRAVSVSQARELFT